LLIYTFTLYCLREREFGRVCCAVPLRASQEQSQLPTDLMASLVFQLLKSSSVGPLKLKSQEMCLERLDLLRRIALEKTVTQNRDLSLCARLLFENYDEYQPVFLSGPALLACMKLGLTCATGGLKNRPGPPSDLRTWLGRPPDSLQTPFICR
jgi:hypothetical protein